MPGTSWPPWSRATDCQMPSSKESELRNCSVTKCSWSALMYSLIRKAGSASGEHRSSTPTAPAPAADSLIELRDWVTTSCTWSGVDAVDRSSAACICPKRTEASSSTRSRLFENRSARKVVATHATKIDKKAMKTRAIVIAIFIESDRVTNDSLRGCLNLLLTSPTKRARQPGH